MRFPPPDSPETMTWLTPRSVWLAATHRTAAVQSLTRAEETRSEVASGVLDTNNEKSGGGEVFANFDRSEAGSAAYRRAASVEVDDAAERTDSLGGAAEEEGDLDAVGAGDGGGLGGDAVGVGSGLGEGVD